VTLPEFARDEPDTMEELSPEARLELLDPEGWRGVLETYARTMKLAVALTDSGGRVLGQCYNPQPVWRLARGEAPQTSSGCYFCLAPHVPCTAVADAVRTGGVVLVHDRAGLAHVAVPLSLGGQPLGALIAGQVFNTYPEPLPLDAVARTFRVSPQQLWQAAIRQVPVSHASLLVYGNLLSHLGQAFLGQRYSAILHRKLDETNRRYQLMIDGAKDYALFTVNAAGIVTSWNSGAERLLGYSQADIQGQDFTRFYAPEEVRNGAPRRTLEKAARAGWAEDKGWRIRKDGTRFLADGSMSSLGKGNDREFGKLIHDVSERRKSEAALLQAHKLESIGILAGGIAHDFNNLLTGILGSVSFAKTTLQPDHPAFPVLDVAEHSCEKAAKLTMQLLAYAGKGQFVVTRFDFSALISELLPLIATSVPKAVRVETDLAPGLPWIEADASQIEQIVMNLVINGGEAMGLNGGTLRIATGVAVLEAGTEGKPGRHVYMEVRDSGCGMSEATKASMFDPFFTTKFTGRGLGLAAVSGILRGHKGRMELDSAPGKGTAFRVFFPAVDAAPALRVETAPAPAAFRGTGTILVVDDEPAVRKLAQVILEQRGYSVLAAADGQEGVELFRGNAAEIVAVLLDMTMPVMSGKEAFRLIREIRPDVPVIVSTGYSELVAIEQFGSGAAIGFVQKPYTVMKLGDSIRAAIEQPQNL
jgi:PAS domain S-box-containing protein